MRTRDTRSKCDPIVLTGKAREVTEEGKVPCAASVPDVEATSCEQPTSARARHRTRDELREIGLGHGGFDLGYGKVTAGDAIESGERRGQVIEVFHDGDVWVVFDDDPERTRTLKWRQIRTITASLMNVDGTPGSESADRQGASTP
jgi:hypothetical protein